MQRFTIIGRIGNDLQIKITESNKKVLEFSIVENEKIGNNDITTWLNCVAWERKAETLAQSSEDNRVSKFTLDGMDELEFY